MGMTSVVEGLVFAGVARRVAGSVRVVAVVVLEAVDAHPIMLYFPESDSGPGT